MSSVLSLLLAPSNTEQTFWKFRNIFWFSVARMSTSFERFAHLAHATDFSLYNLFALMRCSLARIKRNTKIFTRVQFDVVKMKRERCHVRRDCGIFQNVPSQSYSFSMNFTNVEICFWYYDGIYHDMGLEENPFNQKTSQKSNIYRKS